MSRKAKATDVTVVKETVSPVESIALPTPNVSRMGYNPANFAYWIGAGPWVSGYMVYYVILALCNVTLHITSCQSRDDRGGDADFL